MLKIRGCGAGFAAALFLAPLTGAAQQVTDQCAARLAETPMTIIVPNRAGGGYDTYARAFAPELGAVAGSRVNVVNVPGGGGRLALSQVSSQSANELLLLIESFADAVSGTDGDPDLDVTADQFVPLGIIVSEPAAWLGRPGIDLADPDLATLVSSASSLQSNLVDVGLTARALGLDLSVVAGYEGSSETSAAVLRGEVDVTAQTVTTALRNSAGTDLQVLLVLSDTPDARVPDAPVLDGPNGLAQRRGAGLSPEELAKRRAAAAQVTSLSTTRRGFLTAASVDADLLACLREASDIAILSTAFRDAAEAQGRPVAPQGADVAIKAYAAAIRAFADVAPDLETVASELSD